MRTSLVAAGLVLLLGLPGHGRGQAAAAAAPEGAEALPRLGGTAEAPAPAGGVGEEEDVRPEDQVRLDVIRVVLAPGAVREISLEEYVAGVIGGEMPLDFPPEALKAQAVAARTYALAKRLSADDEEREYDVGATVLHQVYAPGRGVDPRARRAVEDTRGEVLVHDHRPIEAYFHSTCGGRTEAGGPALERDLSYLQSVPCGRCDESPRAAWTVRVPADELGRLAGLGRAATAARVVERTPSGRAARVEVAAGSRKVMMSAVDLRRRAGYGRLHSLAFSVRRDGGSFAFEGRGSGHGAGLCQWGAAGLARVGQGYREILAHYYPGAELTRMY